MINITPMLRSHGMTILHKFGAVFRFQSPWLKTPPPHPYLWAAV
jgi:hypothetical protein